MIKQSLIKLVSDCTTGGVFKLNSELFALQNDAVHLFDGSLRRHRIAVADQADRLARRRLRVVEDFGAHNDSVAREPVDQVDLAKPGLNTEEINQRTFLFLIGQKEKAITPKNTNRNIVNEQVERGSSAICWLG